MNRRLFLTMLAAMPVIAVSACAAPAAPVATSAPAATTTPTSDAQPAPSQPPKLKAVATFSLIGEMVQNVAGDKVEWTTLVGPDADVHDFEPVPSDAAKVADAQLIFENGLEMESWLDNLYQSSGSKATRVVASDSVKTREGEAHEEHEDEAHADEAKAEGTPGATAEAKEAGHEGEKEGEHGDEHGEFDPHIWQNPQNVIQMVRNISAALAAADPANAATYQANADSYVAKLEALDKEIVAMVEQVPADRRKIVTSHDALGYFADRYGFTVVGSVIPALSTEAGDPSAQDIAKLVEAIKTEGVKAIFLESMANPRLVERVAQEAGVKVGPELYTDALGAPGSEGGTYIDAMRFNARALVDSLK
jgi:zinc/manganese transport system substrate-binding protein